MGSEMCIRDSLSTRAQATGKKEKIWQLLTIHFSSVATFLFVCTEKSSRKCETNPCKFRDCAGPRKRSPRPWKTDDALALAPPEGKRDKMQFVKKGSARRCLYTLFVGPTWCIVFHCLTLVCIILFTFYCCAVALHRSPRERIVGRCRESTPERGLLSFTSSIY